MNSASVANLQNKHIVFICEMGGNYGHITPLLSIAQAMLAVGAKVSFVLPDLANADVLYRAGLQFRLFQAPARWMSQAKSPQSPATFSETLLLKGYSQPDRLAPAVQAWHDLLDTIQPDMAFFDFSPTAQLASRNLPFKKVTFGSGFWMPPLITPMPKLPGRQASAQRREQSDQTLLTNINKALAQNNMVRLSCVSKLHDSHEQFLMTVRELDCYRAMRPKIYYWGFLHASNGTRQAIWPEGISTSKVRVFAYLSTTFPFLKQLLSLLNEYCTGHIFIGGKGAKNFIAQSTSSLILSSEPYKVNSVLPQCDAVICHAGYSTVTQALAEGKPILCIPLQYEQQLTAEAVEEQSVGGFIRPAKKWPQLETEIVESLKKLPAQKIHAQAFQANYRAVYTEEPIHAIVSRCSELLSA